MHLLLQGAGNVNCSLLFDIAIGAAGSEVIIAADIPARSDANFLLGSYLPINVDIPAGSRIAIRAQGSIVSTGMETQILLEDRAIGSLANPIAYGVNASGSPVIGVTIDPGGTINTKSAYVQITASTTARIDILTVYYTGLNTSSTFAAWSIDIATGAAGAETIIIPDLRATANPAGGIPNLRPAYVTLPVSIPAGTRIAARVSANFTTASARVITVAVVGMQQPAGVTSLGESVQFSVVRPV
jgi:hypothetical protein